MNYTPSNHPLDDFYDGYEERMRDYNKAMNRMIVKRYKIMAVIENGVGSLPPAAN